jgi:hypothetical protein
MRFSKCIGLFIIVLVLTIEFNGGCLYAEDGNNTSGNNTTDENIIQINLTGQTPYYDSPSHLGNANKITDIWMKKPVMHTPDWNPPNVRSRHWYNFFGWLWDCIKYGLYCIWYPIEVIGYGIWFTLQMIAWFFVIIAWLPVAIVESIINIKDFVNAFTLFGWCFGGNDNLKHDNSLRIIKLKNGTQPITNNTTINTTNKTNINATTNVINETLNQTDNKTIMNNTNESINGSNEVNYPTIPNDFNLNEYLLENHYSSFSNCSLENITDKNLINCINDLNIQDRNIKKTLLVLNTMFESINNVIALIDTVVTVVSCVAAGLAVPTEGTSIPAAGGAEIAKESAKITFQGIFEGIVLEGVSTMLANIVSKFADDQYYVNEGKIGARGIIISKRMYNAGKSIKAGQKFKTGKGVFGVIRDTMGMLCTVAELVWSINYDIEKGKVMDEQDYRKNNHITVC